MAVRRWHLPEQACLLFVAGLYFAWGCGSGLELSDEGQIVFGSWRTASGGIPYRDFSHLYGPSLFFLNGALLRWFGEDLLVIRISLVILKSITALLVYLCARLVASRASSLLAYFLFLAIWGTPWVFNTPYANHYAMTLLLGGVVVFVSLRTRFALACFSAGVCFGLAATFKQTTGALCVLWFALFLLVEPNSSEASDPDPSSTSAPRVYFGARLIRWTVLLGALAAIFAYQATGTTAWNALVISGPLVLTVFFLVTHEFRGGVPPRQCIRSALGITSCAAGASIPVLAYVAVYASLGQLHALAFNMVGLATKVTWFVPFPLPDWRTLARVSTVVTMFLAIRLWRTPAGSGKARRYVAAAVTGLFLISVYAVWDSMRMPRGAWAFFRSGVWYGEVFQPLFLLPIGIVLVALPTILRESNWRSYEGADMQGPGARRLLFFAAATSLLSLHPAADLFHVFMVLPVFLPLLAWELDAFRWVPESNNTAGRFVSASAVILFGLILAAPFVHATVRPWMDRQPSVPRMKRATGIVGLSSRQPEQVELVSYLETVGSDQGLLILTDEQLLYFLGDTSPVMEDQEFILYLVGAGLIADEDARALIPEGPFVERLREGKPIIVDAVDNRLAMRFREAFPHVARFIDENYRLEREIGLYRVLKHREDRAG